MLTAAFHRPCGLGSPVAITIFPDTFHSIHPGLVVYRPLVDASLAFLLRKRSCTPHPDIDANAMLSLIAFEDYTKNRRPPVWPADVGGGRGAPWLSPDSGVSLGIIAGDEEVECDAENVECDDRG